ncbi:RdRP-domain-containing protein [Rhizopus microsporus var. microsporus]|uniref:RNA-dependent RNA polymerase n=1 Tax=Rhizopus microsporus var. microsporus TaxID=86635 RepID=A0A1X0RJ52_RHIZD|nr:RdRP-domain-containing protein [Rhizopus microsporus var. microsporus]
MNDLPFAYLSASDVCVIVHNLHPSIKREDLWNLFEEYGVVKQIHIHRNNTVIKTAVIFSSAVRLNELTSKPLFVRNHQLNIRQYPLHDYISWRCEPFTGERLSLGGLSTSSIFQEEWSTLSKIQFHVNVLEQYVEIFFYYLHRQYRLRIRYQEALKDVVIKRSNGSTTVIIAAKYPAYFWRLKNAQEEKNFFDFSCWERVTEIPLNTEKPPKNKNPIKAYTNSSTSVRLNSWSVYLIELTLDDDAHKALSLRLESATAQKVLHTTTIQVMKARKPKIDYEERMSNLPFEVQYMLQHTLCLKILREYNIEEDFFEVIENLEPRVACRLLALISAGQQRHYNPGAIIYNIFKKNPHITNLPEVIPEDHTYLRKVIITPTSIYPLQPVLQKMNHLQYEFKQYADRFLLVEFTDEELNSIVPSPYPMQNDLIHNRIFKVLKSGLLLAGRRYEFLCTSTDDLRNHSCWFFAPTDDLNRDKIIYWMGDFDEIKSVPRYIASVGQVMAQRLTSLEIKLEEIEEIDNYEQNGFIFAKECGKVSSAVARDIKEVLELKYTPSVIKFNLAGGKGILMLSSFLPKRKVQLRSGQIHFNTNRLTLEVIKISKRKRAYLNKQSILLLSSMGIHPGVFQNLIDNMIDCYLMGAANKGNLLNDLMDEYYSRYFTGSFKRLVFSGFLKRQDPFIMNLIISFQNKILKQLKDEYKLYIRNGARAFAIMDETGSLERGEVFFQTSTSAGINTVCEVIEGPCVIFRDSSLSPGNVMLATAVNKPKLKNHTNVLIYSANELTDLPGKCSNDDVDEDNFTIIWDQRLVPLKAGHSPIYSTDDNPPELGRDILVSDAIKFVVNYISTDRRELLKDAYTAFADRCRANTYDGLTLHLGQQLAMAIDFVKTGIRPSLNEEIYEYPIPDFMKEDPFKTYPSIKPLGFIHRTLQSVDSRPYLLNRCDYDPRLYLDGMHQYILEARTTRVKYDSDLRLLMGQYGIRSEIEFVSGYIDHWPKYMSHNDRKNITRKAKEAYTRLKKAWRHSFELEFYQHDGLSKDKLDEKMELKAAAWYYVAYHPAENASSSKEIGLYNRFFSFL